MTSDGRFISCAWHFQSPFEALLLSFPFYGFSFERTFLRHSPDFLRLFLVRSLPSCCLRAYDVLVCQGYVLE